MRQKLPAAELGLAVNFAGSGAVADYRSVLERMVCLCLNRGDRDRPRVVLAKFIAVRKRPNSAKNWG